MKLSLVLRNTAAGLLLVCVTFTITLKSFYISLRIMSSDAYDGILPPISAFFVESPAPGEMHHPHRTAQQQQRAGSAKSTAISEQQNSLSASNSPTDLLRSPDKKRSILFVHVGKSGGGTIRIFLDVGCRVLRNPRKMKNCLAQLAPSRLSMLVLGYFHCFLVEPKRTLVDRATTYLYTLRHPVDRALSWYHYVTPRNCNSESKRDSPNCKAAAEARRDPNGFAGRFFGQCFPNAEDWTNSIVLAHRSHSNDTDTIDATRNATTNNCTALGHDVLTGRNLDWREVPLAAHAIANLQHYAGQTIQRHPDKEVLVVRTEHLWEDLKALDRQLGGTGSFGAREGQNVTHSSETFRMTGIGEGGESLSLQHMQSLCCALTDELIVYRDLLQGAANLPPDEKQKTWNGAVHRCGFDSWDDLTRMCAADADA